MLQRHGADAGGHGPLREGDRPLNRPQARRENWWSGRPMPVITVTAAVNGQGLGEWRTLWWSARRVIGCLGAQCERGAARAPGSRRLAFWGAKASRRITAPRQK